MEQFLEAPRWVDEKRVAELTGIAVQTLRNWRFQGNGPAYFKIGRSVRYRLSDIVNFMELRRVEPFK
jgi:predicted DNA-binding transcriptional regulator AlpA